MSNANIFHLLGVLEGVQRYCSLYPLKGTRILPQGWTSVSWLLLPCLCIPSPPWLATVWNCPLKFREGHRGWNLFLFRGRRKTSVPRSPIGSCSVPYLALFLLHGRGKKQRMKREVASLYIATKISVQIFAFCPYNCEFACLGDLVTVVYLSGCRVSLLT